MSALARGSRGRGLLAMSIVLILVVGGLNLAGSLFGGSQGGHRSVGASVTRGGPGGSVVRSAAVAGLSPEGLPDFIGSTRAPELFHHGVDTVALATANGEAALQNPAWLAYAHSDESFYVAVPPSSVDVVPFNGGNLQVEATFAVGDSPFGVAVDNATNEVFVSNTGSNNVSVLSDTSQAIVGTVPVGSEPYGVAYDSATGDVYVANGGSGNVSVISPVSLSVVATVGVGAEPMGIAFDPTSGDLFVADHASNDVTVISGASESVVATVEVGGGPYGVAVDGSSGSVYVTDEGSSNVSVISVASDEVIASIPVVYPWAVADLQGVAYDPKDGLVWAGAGAFYAVVIDPGTEAVIAFVNTDPSGVVFDPDSGDVCVTNTANVTFECFLFPADSTSSVQIQLDETGLPAGTTWAVNLSSAFTPEPYPVETSAGSTISFAVLGGGDTYAFEAWPTDGYAAYPPTGTVDTGLASSVVVNVSYLPSVDLFPVTFEESGLPSGMTWYVNLSGLPSLSGSGSTLSTSLPNGSYTYTVASADPAFSGYGGGLTVNGAALQVPVPFSEPVYTATFAETGLPNGTEWTVTVGGVGAVSSTSTDAVVSVPNGTYPYTTGTPTANWTGSGGSFRISGTDVTVPVAFHAINSSVTINETGLPAGPLAAYGWTVTLHGVVDHTASASVGFTIPNGTYGLLVTGPSGYASNTSGRLTVLGSTHLTVVFVEARTLSLSFTQHGLGKGQSWCVEVDGRRACSTTGSAAYTNLTRASYNYSVVSPLSGQRIAGRSGVTEATLTGGVPATVTLRSDTKVALTFEYPYAATFTESGPYSGTWSVTVGKTTLSNFTGDSIVFHLGNGTYGYKIGTEHGYTHSGSPTRVTVHGGPASVVVVFKAKKGYLPAALTEDRLGGSALGLNPWVGPQLRAQRSVS